ncbi:MAG: SCP2 sterol-binding domain-containing protein [Acidimicrobiales bacterium]|nr:SCP2 sterol-binding domain-containing protein [Acidimicrobiales bacterium]
MPEFLSPEWVTALNQAAAQHPGLKNDQKPLTVGYRITDGPQWCIVFNPGAVQVLTDPTLSQDVWFITNRDTARQIATGTLDPLTAIIDGTMTLGGDPRRLTENQSVIDQLGSLLAAVPQD